ncbi:MAG: GNAT family N-acetyltransferase [Eubacteriales bacterium]
MSREQFIKIYKSNPCRFHASALWKTLNKTDVEIHINEKSSGIKTIKISDNSNLYLYYDIEKNIPSDINNYKIALLHNSQVAAEYKNADKYFRLIYDKRISCDCQKECIFEEVNVSRETSDVAKFINRCYENTNLSQNEIEKWMHHPTFDSSLWIWAKDKETKKIIGLAIAEYDKDIKEGLLEWIQVLPEHRGKSIGKAMVCELISRLSNADFITVSGKADNASAEKLYRSCGFVGDDIWYVINK